MERKNLPKRLFKNVSWLTFGFQFGNVLQLVFFTLLGQWFEAEGVGVYQTALTFVTFLSVFANFGLSFYLLTELSKDTNDPRHVAGRVYALRLVSVITMTVLGTGYILAFRLDETPLYLWAVLLLGLHEIFLWLGDVFMADFKAHERMHVPALLMVLLKTVSVGLSVAALVIWKDLILAFAAYPLAAGVYFIAAFLLRSRSFGFPKLEFRGMGAVFAANLPFGVALVLNDALFKQDIFIMDGLAGKEAVGFYSPPLKILFFFMGFSLALQEAIIPALVELWNRDRKEMPVKAAKFLGGLLLLSLPVSAGLFIVAKDLMILWLGEGFIRSVTVLQWVCWTAVLAMAQAVFGAMLTATGRQKERTIVIGITLAFAIITNLILVKLFADRPELGVGIGRVLTEGFPLLLYMILVRRLIGPVPWMRVTWRPAVASAVMVLVCYVLTSWSIWVDIPLGALVYGIVLGMLGVFGPEQREMIRQVLKKG